MLNNQNIFYAEIIIHHITFPARCCLVRIARQKLYATTPMESVMKFDLLRTHRRVPVVGLGHYTQVLDSSLVERVTEGHY